MQRPKLLIIICIFATSLISACTVSYETSKVLAESVLSDDENYSYLPMVTNGLNAEIPSQEDWELRGIALSSGSAGTWDVRLHGQISPCAVVKIEGTYFLYYIGADGDRSTDGGPRHRALGVATSPDGINFTKYSGNPIITYLPNNNEEEGIFSCGATLDDDGNVVLYYGALRAKNSTSESVDIDIRMRVSNDGLNFENDLLILQESGDELTPLGTFHFDGNWHVYYLGPLAGGTGPLQLLNGPSMDNLPNNTNVLTGGQIIGGGDPVWLGTDQLALFIVRDFVHGYIDVRLTSANSPHQLSAPIETYDFGGEWRHITVFLDQETGTWFMYHKLAKGNDIYVRTAAVGGSVNQPATSINSAD